VPPGSFPSPSSGPPAPGRQPARAFPWFIAGFVAAALLRTLLPSLEPLWVQLAAGARHLLILVLFLIGCGMTRPLLRATGLRPLAQGIALWLLIATGALLVVLHTPLPG
jgi:uncharacterized membrane protein YadS